MPAQKKQVKRKPRGKTVLWSLNYEAIYKAVGKPRRKVKKKSRK